MTLTIGEHLPNLKESKIKYGNKEFEYLGEFDTGQHEKQMIPEISMLYLNTPYLWGGKSIFGIDCSGFVQQVYKFCGIKLPRDAYQQAELDEDLVFVVESAQVNVAFVVNIY